MITMEAYRKDPCGSLSIPLWKWRSMIVPEGIRIVHDRDYVPRPGFSGERYFRIRHDLKSIPERNNGNFRMFTAKTDDLPAIAEVINRSYTDLKVSEEYLVSLKKTPVYEGRLWLLAVHRESGRIAGCAIGDLDREVREGILEWVQVLPEYRRQGVGTLLVTELLRRMEGAADFATVSGQCGNETKPERLYRSCGFTGSDVWHILRKV